MKSEQKLAQICHGQFAESRQKPGLACWSKTKQRWDYRELEIAELSKPDPGAGGRSSTGKVPGVQEDLSTISRTHGKSQVHCHIRHLSNGEVETRTFLGLPDTLAELKWGGYR